MNRQTEVEELDRGIESLLSDGKVNYRADWQSLMAIASDLRKLPSVEFKNRLKSELIEESETAHSTASIFEQVTGAAAFAEVLPSLGRSDYHLLPADQRSFLVSFISHTALIVLIASGIWTWRVPAARQADKSSEVTYMPVPGKGGGGSGDRSPVVVSKGTPPRMRDQQFAPPLVVVHRSDPILPVQPTVVGPPDLKLPQSRMIGDFMSSNVTIPSNGIGTGGGAGSGVGTGLGSGVGLGVGPGFDRGAGGNVFRPGAGVIAPRAIYDPEPEYSEEARKVKQQGTVLLSLIVDEQGRPRNIRVARSLGMGLDEKAIEAVKNWKFAPGTKDGIPVAVQVDVEVSFRLY
jgi:periplasmic protein TonB